MHQPPGDPPDPPPASARVAEARALAERSAIAAGEGQIDQARRGFEQAVAQGGDDVRVLFLCFQFHFRIGELEPAEEFARRRLVAAGQDAQTPHAARAHTNLGLVLQYRGKLDEAEGAMRRALAINTRLRNDYGIARDLGNLSLVAEARGDLDQAEQLLNQALVIAERIGAEDIMATKLTNLGEIALARGRAGDARKLWSRAVEIFERIGPAKHRDKFTKRLRELDEREA
ncbi:MAG: tetratricopeptide repeat protein [Phycisphaerales bacterium]|nr:tetratricopeptide repeat protein [Phycisphaerales bacterium]